MSERLQLQGRKFGKLVVLSFSHIHHSPCGTSSAYWRCKCRCGVIKLVAGHNLMSKGIRSCGICVRIRPGSAFRQLLSSYKRAAYGRRLSFNLSSEVFRKLTSSVCYYCGLEPKQRTRTHPESSRQEVYTYNGVDRVDNAKGYFKSNCVSCCKECNMAKKDLTKKQFLGLVKRVFNNRIKGLR